jgi:hypothetical protein
MNFTPYRVHVIIDPFYGERLSKLPADEPAWVIDTEMCVKGVKSLIDVTS